LRLNFRPSLNAEATGFLWVVIAFSFVTSGMPSPLVSALGVGRWAKTGNGRYVRQQGKSRVRTPRNMSRIDIMMEGPKDLVEESALCFIQ
jgi:hypothetical protein